MNFLKRFLHRKKLKKFWDLQGLILPLINNPIARKYLGVPLNKRIVKVTANSVHFQKNKTQRIAIIYGPPVIKEKGRKAIKTGSAIAIMLLGLGIPKSLVLPLIALTPDTFQPSAKDNRISKSANTTNYGSGSYLVLYDLATAVNRAILEFDISSLPAGVVITAATLNLYYYNYATTDPVGKTVYVYKLTRTDWVELESTWEIYKTGSNWTAAGGDYVTSSPSGGSTTFPASYGWMSLNVLAIIQDAYSNSNPAELLVKFEDETLASGESLGYFYSNDYTDDTDLCPKLVVTYIVQKSVSDSGAGVDVVGIKAQIGIQDSGQGLETPGIVGKLTLQDSGIGTDAISKLIIYLKSVLDSGVGSEELKVQLIKAVQDSGSGTDVISAIKAMIIITESGLGADVIGILSKILIQESGAGVDIAQMKGVVDISESGIGSDIISAILAKLLIQDSGVGAETIQMTAQEFIQDSGVGADLISILQKVLIQEIGLGIDRIKVPPFYSDKYSKQGDAYTDKYQKQKTKYQDKFFY